MKVFVAALLLLAASASPLAQLQPVPPLPQRPVFRSEAAVVALNVTVQDRAALIRRVGELHVERRQQLADIIVLEMGKPVEQALAEVDFAGAIYEYYADHADEFLKDEPIQLLDGDGSAVVRRSPLGVLLGIMP